MGGGQDQLRLAIGAELAQNVEIRGDDPATLARADPLQEEPNKRSLSTM